MCEFLSWIEKDNKSYFLTRQQIDSPQGEILKKRFPGEGELVGHAAIRAYYDIVGGENKECTDFSTPDNFPDVIVKAIKSGEFRDMSYPFGLLNSQSYAHISLVKKAYADWVKANADWVKANADWKKAYADREKANADWVKANANREKAYADWVKAIKPFFWDLFAIPENRNLKWR